MTEIEIPEFKFCLVDNCSEEFVPTRSEPNATGYDCRSRINLDVNHGDMFKIPLGFKMLCPVGWYAQLHPRSSSFMKKDIIPLIGIIDQDFNGEVCFVGRFFSKNWNYVEQTNSFLDGEVSHESLMLQINIGDKIAQLVPEKVKPMKTGIISLEDYEKELKARNAIRNGGFGSTGAR